MHAISANDDIPTNIINKNYRNHWVNIVDKCLRLFGLRVNFLTLKEWHNNWNNQNQFIKHKCRWNDELQNNEK